jgi:hypothetical protein
MTQATFVQIPIDLISYARTLKLSGTQYDLWLYLWSKDPFGDRFVEIPSPDAIAAELGVNPRTIQRAAQRLQDADLFDFQIEAWKCRNTTQSTPIKTPDKKLRVRTKRSHPGQKDLISDKKISSQTKRSHLGQKDPISDKKILISSYNLYQKALLAPYRLFRPYRKSRPTRLGEVKKLFGKKLTSVLEARSKRINWNKKSNKLKDYQRKTA